MGCRTASPLVVRLIRAITLTLIDQALGADSNNTQVVFWVGEMLSLACTPIGTRIEYHYSLRNYGPRYLLYLAQGQYISSPEYISLGEQGLE